MLLARAAAVAGLVLGPATAVVAARLSPGPAECAGAPLPLSWWRRATCPRPRLPPGRQTVRRRRLHVRARHQHGTRAAYVQDRCGCGPCTAANTAAQRRRSTAIAYGTWTGLLDAAEVRAHVQSLREPPPTRPTSPGCA